MQWKTVRIFISSTFNDMHAERDYLVKTVFPELAVWCEQRKLRLVDIDLRWGVTAADSQANNAVLACLKNIDESRPFFLCFLGQRRGWVPKDFEISELTLNDYPGAKEYIGKNSVTEMEIEHALLAPMRRIVNGREQSPVPASHALFFFRNNPFDSDTLSQEQNAIYTNAGADNPDKADEELESFKRKVTQNWKNVKYYDCIWNKNTVIPELITEGGDASQGRLCNFNISGTELKNIIFSQLKAEIENEFPDNKPGEAQTDLEKDLEQQEQFVEMLGDGFILRQGDFNALDDYINTGSNGIFVLSAAAGLGKTTLLANYTTKLRNDHHKVYARFCGASNLSAEQYSLWKSIFDEAGIDCPPTMDELRRNISKLFEKLSGIVLIDAVNQLPGGLEMLLWLPSSLPPNVKLIISVKEDEQSAPVLEKLRGTGAAVSSVLPFASDEDKEKLINAYLERYLKNLDKSHMTALCKAPASQNPLYLKIMLSELRIFGAFKKLDDEMDKFGSSPLEAFCTVLQRLEMDAADIKIAPGKVVPFLFGLLGCARRGLSEDELTHCFSRKFTGVHDSDIRAAIRYYLRQMRPFMARREYRTDFLYESFKLAAKEKYQKNETANHKFLSDCFMHFANLHRNFRFEGEIARAFEELPYHLNGCGEKETLERMLSDYLWLYNKVRLCGAEQAIEDYQYMEQYSEKPYIFAIRDCLTLSAHILSKDFRQLPSQLWGRLHNAGETQTILLQAKNETKYPWLRPERPFMSASSGGLIKTVNYTMPFDQVVRYEDCFLHAEFGNTVKMVCFITGECIHTFLMPATVTAMCIFDRTLIAGLDDATILLMSLKTNQCYATLQGHTNKIVQFTTRNGELISLDMKGTVKIWSLTDHVCMETHDTNICNAIKLEVYNDKLIAVVRKSELYKTVIVMSLRSWRQVLSWDEFTGNLRDMKIWGDKLYATTQNGVCVFSLDDFQKTENWDGHSAWVDSLDIRGNLLATASTDHTVKLWNIDTGKCLKTFSGHSNGVKIVVFYEKHLVSCADEIKIWAPDNMAEEKNGMQHQGNVNALVSQGPYLFSGSQDGTVRQWDSKTYDCIRVFNRPDSLKAWVMDVACNENAIFAGYAGDRGSFTTLQGWSMNSGGTIGPFSDCVSDVNALSLSGDNIIIAQSFRNAPSLAIYSPLTGKKTATLSGIDGAMLDVKCQKGKIYGGGREGVLGVWSADTDECILKAESSGRDISSIGLWKDRIYAAYGYNFKQIGVLASGETKWQYTLPARLKVSRITVSGNHIIGFDRENDLLTVWLADNGMVLCDMHVDDYISACVMVDGKIFFGTVNGHIHVLIPENFICSEDSVSEKETAENDGKKQASRGIFSKWFRK